MKDNVFEFLLALFEKTLTRLKESTEHSSDERHASAPVTDQLFSERKNMLQLAILRSPSQASMRVFTEDECRKLSKASHQFLRRLTEWQLITPEVMELIMHRLLFSESPCVDLQETKWTIRNTLADRLLPDQLAFLDMILYQREDGVSVH